MKCIDDYSESKKIQDKLSTDIIIPKLNGIDNIYHYTSSSAFEKIITSSAPSTNQAALRFTNALYLNDKQELKDMVDHIKNGITQKLHAYNAKQILEGKEEFKLPNDFFLNVVSEVEKLNVFVFCASTKSDELAIWNYYTKGSKCDGYNLLLDLTTLICSLVNNNVDILRGCGLSYGHALYDCDIKANIIEDLLNFFDHGLSECLNNCNLVLYNYHSSHSKTKIKESAEFAKKYPNFKNNTLREVAIARREIKKVKQNIAKMTEIYSYKKLDSEIKFIADAYIDYFYYFKNAAFIHESEVRIAITIDDQKMQELITKSLIKYHLSNGVFIPYLELKFDTNAIKGVTVGPIQKSDLNIKSLRSFLKTHKVIVNDEDFRIEESKVPLRW